MNDEETIYADWSALRIVVPVGLLMLVVAIVGFLGLRFVLLSDDDAASEEGPVTAVPLTPEGQAQVVLDEFLTGLAQNRFIGQSFAFDEGAEVQAEFEEITERLGSFTLTSRRDPVRLVDQANATSKVMHDWVLADGVSFTSEADIDLVLVGTDWLVDWQPSALTRSLNPGDVLVRERVVSARAPILGRGGVPLIDNRAVVEIGVVPRLSDDIAGLTNRLGQLLGEDPEQMRAKISPSPSDSLVSLVVRRPDEILPFRGELQTIPGVVLTDSTYPLPPSDGFARALLGRSAEVTAEIIEQSPDYFQAGDVAGRSGLQKLYNEQLAGRSGFQVAVRRKFPGAGGASGTDTSVLENPATGSGGDQGTDDQGTDDQGTGGQGGADSPDGQDGTSGQDGTEGGSPDPVPAVDADVVYLEPPETPTPLQLTIDAEVQAAAESALARTGNNSAMVVIEVSTGHVLAAANGPFGAVDNFALTGQYPPGSIFKVATAYAALRKGIGPDTPIDCPEIVNVNGRDFRNAQGEVLGTVPFQINFARSCNTAFVNLANSLDNSEFSSAAQILGVGAQYQLGTGSFPGTVPNPSGPVEKAATSFGQSRVLMSPLSAAVMAASVAGGAYRPPVLVVDPSLPPPAEQPLDQNAVDGLRRMMRSVVLEGTGGAVSNVAGGAVFGKTGTAEYGEENPPRTHAWFVGFQEDLAFAVFVEDGGFGGATAAPIAGTFLNDIGNR